MKSKEKYIKNNIFCNWKKYVIRKRKIKIILMRYRRLK
jgi:hypothetical protein